MVWNCSVLAAGVGLILMIAVSTIILVPLMIFIEIDRILRGTLR
jgi:hypothetical protein